MAEKPLLLAQLEGGTADFLSGFGDMAAGAVAVLRAADAVMDWVRQGVEYCMNRYN